MNEPDAPLPSFDWSGNPDRNYPLGCWNWTGAKNKDGYGVFWSDGKTWRAHRWSWENAYGEIPPEANVIQKCRNRLCVRPEHLAIMPRKKAIK